MRRALAPRSGRIGLMHYHVSAAARATVNAWADRAGLVVGLGLIMGGALICWRAWWRR